MVIDPRLHNYDFRKASKTYAETYAEGRPYKINTQTMGMILIDEHGNETRISPKLIAAKDNLDSVPTLVLPSQKTKATLLPEA